MSDFPTKNFAERLRIIRGKRYGKYRGNIKLANDVNLTPEIIANFIQEENPREPSLDLIYGLAKLKEDINWLLTGESLQNKTTGNSIIQTTGDITSNSEMILANINDGKGLHAEENHYHNSEGFKEAYILAKAQIKDLRKEVRSLKNENEALKHKLSKE